MSEAQHELEQQEASAGDEFIVRPEDGEIRWRGAEALADHLVSIEELEDDPRNPNVGNPDEIAKSLLRFGQARAVTFRMADVIDGDERKQVPMLVAGHHTRKAAKLLGWTHIAAIPSEFETEAEAGLYLLADNQLARLSTIDEAAQLNLLGDATDLQGTGFTIDDVETMQFNAGRTETVSLGREPGYAEDPETAAERAATLARSNRMVERVLMVTEEQASQLDADIEVLMGAYGLTSRVATMLKAANEEAARVRAQ